MTATETAAQPPARTLTVAHQTPGECAYCDKRHARIVAAVLREAADLIDATYTGPGIDRHVRVASGLLRRMATAAGA